LAKKATRCESVRMHRTGLRSCGRNCWKVYKARHEDLEICIAILKRILWTYKHSNQNISCGSHAQHRASARLLGRLLSRTAVRLSRRTVRDKRRTRALVIAYRAPGRTEPGARSRIPRCNRELVPQPAVAQPFAAGEGLSFAA